MTLDSFDDSEPFNTTIKLCTKGSGFPNNESALIADAISHSELVRTFASLRIGAYFGSLEQDDISDPPKVTSSFPKSIPTIHNTGPRLYLDQFGLKLHSSESVGTQTEIKFRAHGTASVTSTFEGFSRALAEAQKTQRISKPEEIAYIIFSSSSLAGLVDARFLTLMMALESLIDQKPRNKEEDAHFRKLIENTEVLLKSQEDSKLLPNPQEDSKSNWKSIIGSLRELNRRESVRQAGTRVVTRLGTRLYAGCTPQKFFSECYSIRSRLIHGELPLPTNGDVEKMTWPLQDLVCDLIANPVVL